MMENQINRPKIIITGSAGFIGFHLACQMLKEGWSVVGVDAFTDYYDVDLKKHRHQILRENEFFKEIVNDVTNSDFVYSLFSEEKADIVVHLAAQAGVRYSLESPSSYVEANLVGTFNIIESARRTKPNHLLIASTSSVYGANIEMPFNERHKTDTPLSFYAATKKCCEVMSYSYAHLYELPVTCFRFFTVYGPWGRPDMALFKFTKAMLEGREIEIYNHGEMSRDFTYISDLVQAIFLLIPLIPGSSRLENGVRKNIPWRVVNIGNSRSEKLLDLVSALESNLGFPAKKKFLDMQKGDVKDTWADSSFLSNLTEYRPETSLHEGVAKFVHWYRSYYQI